MVLIYSFSLTILNEMEAN